MVTQEHECQGCQHHNSCEDVYRTLGQSNTAPVAVKVCIAFVLPLFAFVISLAVAEGILEKPVGTQGATLIGFVVALFSAIGVAALGSWIMRTWPKTTRNGL
ncbi:MAG: hypothetical protein K9N55_18660 [Phycisphaerae bacterium]|nr:hypothetical protein [Phycisphaerae bacterium]